MGQVRNGESFAAQGDDGRVHLVTRWQERVDTADREGSRPSWAPSGFEYLRLEDGRAVQLLEDES